MSTEMRIDLVEPGADQEEIGELTRRLRQELLELDVDDVAPAEVSAAPPGSKGLELAAFGALLVHMRGSVDAVASVVTALRGWLSRGTASGRAVKITVDGRTLELSAATAEQQQRVVDEFLRSLSEPSAPPA